MTHRILAALLLIPWPAVAGPESSAPVATVAAVTPILRVKLPGAKEFKNIKAGDVLPEGATVVTLAQGKAEIRFTDGHYVLLSPNTSIEIRKLPKKGSEMTLLRLVKGAVRALVDRGKREGDFGIYANTTVTAVKGTDYEMVRDDADNVDVEVNEGRVNTAEMKSEDAAIAEAAFMAAIMGSIGQMLSEGNRVHTPRSGRMSRPERMSRPPREPHTRGQGGSGRESPASNRGGHDGGNRKGGREQRTGGGRSEKPSTETPSGTETGGNAHGNGGRSNSRKGRGGNNKGPGMPSMPGMGGLGF